MLLISVADLDPSDPLCFWTSWIRIRLSEVRVRILLSSSKKAKIVSKTLIPTILWILSDFLSLKNDVNVPSKRIKQNIFYTNFLLLVSWRSRTKIAGSGSRAWIRESASGSVPSHGSATLPLIFSNFISKQKPVTCSTVNHSPRVGEKLLFLSACSFHCSGLRLQLADVTESHRGECLLVTLSKGKES